MLRIIATLLLCSLTAVASDYYVATNGSNANPGTSSSPWLNIWYSTLHVAAGDTVHVGPGTYQENLTNTINGSLASQITYTGTRGSAGEWLTVIDPSTNASTGWVTAPEVGSGVYKLTGLEYETQTMTINGREVGYVWTLGAMPLSGAFDGGTYSNGVQLLTMPSDQLVTNAQTHVPYYFWDGLKALFGSTNANTTYLRLRDGSDPNGLNIRVSGNWDDHVTSGAVVRSAWTFSGSSNVVVSNFTIRGAWAAVNLKDSSRNITIASNYLANGYCRVFLTGTASNNIITCNNITQDFYGNSTSGGAWSTAASTTTNAMMYILGKVIEGNGSAQDNAIFLNNAGNNNAISSNLIYSGVGNGIVIQGPVAAIQNTSIYGNSISNLSSEGVFIDYGEMNTQIYDNLIANCNANLRYHSMDRTGEGQRTVYVYRNRLWEPAGVGDNIFMFWYGPPTVVTDYPYIWTYNNSFSGGRAAVYPNESGPAQGGMPNCHFLNNVFSSDFYAYCNINWWTNSALVGEWNYNLCRPVTYPASSLPAWFGSSCITNSAYTWVTNSIPSYALPTGSQALGSGLNLATAYPSLPQSYFPLGAWDMGALQSGTRATAVNATIFNIKGQ